jgi:hypothetical protein
MLTDITLEVDLAAVGTRTFTVHFQWNLMTQQSRHILPKGKIATDVYTIDIVIALLNTV